MSASTTKYYICEPGEKINGLCASVLDPNDFSSSLTIQTPTSKNPHKTEAVQGWETTLKQARDIIQNAKDSKFTIKCKIAYKGGDGLLHWTPESQFNLATRRAAANIAIVRKRIKKSKPTWVAGKINKIKSRAK